MPPQKEIYDRLYNLGWKHFLKTTKLHKDLGFKNKSPDEIINFVKITVQEYNEKYAKPSPGKYKKYSTELLTEKDRAAIIAALFKYHPEILHYLEEKKSIA